MDRKGKGIGLVVEIIIALLVFFIVYHFIKTSVGGFNTGITCPVDDDQYVCALASVGCKDVGSRVIYKFRGCDEEDGKKRVCCVKDGTAEDEDTGPKFTLRVYEIQVETKSEDVGKPLEQRTLPLPIKDLVPVSRSGVLPAVTGIPKMVMVEIEAENCPDDCENDIRFIFKAETEAGDDIIGSDVIAAAKQIRVSKKEKITKIEQELVISESSLGKWERATEEKKQSDRNFAFTFPAEFQGERVKFTAKMVYTPAQTEGGETAIIEPVTKEHFIYFDVRSPVIYRGLTTPWTQSKTVSAVCLDPVQCSNIYFQIMDEKPREDPTIPSEPIQNKCDPDSIDPAKAQLIPQLHCLMDEKGRHISCYKTHKDCIELGLATTVSEAYSGMYQGLITGIEAGFIPQNVLIPFQFAENQQSMLSCQPSLPTLGSGGPESKDITTYTFKANEIQNSEQFQFTLNMPSMTGKYLCVYGENAYTKQLYTAAEPIRIHVDRIAPEGTIKFHPLSLRLTFTCDDPHSGCEEYHGLGYVNDVFNFFSALVSTKKSQKASIWCPPFATRGSYRTETRDEIVYGDDQVRVLCLRSVDKAGNAAVSMTTVYNGWQMLAVAIQDHFEDEQKEEYRGR